MREDDISLSSESKSSKNDVEGSLNTDTNTNDQSGGNGTSESSFSLARSETRAVMRTKLIVMAVLAVAAGALGWLVYYFVDQSETEMFEGEFAAFAVEIGELTHLEAKNIFASVDEFATSVTSLALEMEATWPNLTVPDFELRGLKNNDLSKALQLSFVPLLTSEGRAQWEAYSMSNQGWLAESALVQYEYNETAMYDNVVLTADAVEQQRRRMLLEIYGQLHRFTNGDSGELEFVPATDEGYKGAGSKNFAPVWQQAPAPTHNADIINFDMLSHTTVRKYFHGMYETTLPVISEVFNVSFLHDGAVVDDATHPHSLMLHPIFSFFQAAQYQSEDIVAFMAAILRWDSFFSGLLTEGVSGVVVVLHDTCGDHFTYTLDGPTAVFMGEGDLHADKYTSLGYFTAFAPFLNHTFSDTYENCIYDIRLYPSEELEAEYRTFKPFLYMIIVILVFLATAMAFFAYDVMVERRQTKVMDTAKRTTAIVTSLFPKNVRDRIMDDVRQQVEAASKQGHGFPGFRGSNKLQLKSFLDEAECDSNETTNFDTKPIADLFPEVTVMFADIVGFTAWSSVREPAQVFTLLETLFAAIDEIARRRRVFKVETVGDCYVAVAGLPDPRKDHATVMARFARDVLWKVTDLTKKLEVSLGPDTGDLQMRIGLHSGQVTAGVLRGDKSRFQLFGDTMNTAARVETNGAPNRVHVSSEFAAALTQSGKGHWLEERSDLVAAKGKGLIKTFWLSMRGQTTSKSVVSGSTDQESADPDGDHIPTTETNGVEGGDKPDDLSPRVSEKSLRLVDWNVEVMTKVLKQIKATRQNSDINAKFEDPSLDLPENETIFDEVKEIISLPQGKVPLAFPDRVDLDPLVVCQLREFISIIAALYKENPFHNFEHASHVTMSVVKLMSRIVAPDFPETDADHNEDQFASMLHDHTFGITSDPMTHFTCLFSAIIHDVDHDGVPNTQLAIENPTMAHAYKHKSIAEQNSVDIAWNLFMSPGFEALRAAVYSTKAELQHFRQLVVNSVMATDIMDKDNNAFRKARWEKAFSETAVDENPKDTIDRKATIVIEHLIQASDVAHTMQHWHIYTKWNERLFLELYRAFKEGRATSNPVEYWYQGEIGFFDFYIIPLAKKLKQCGVFGVSSDEYLSYASQNRREWELRGRERVEEMLVKFEQLYGKS